MIASKNLSLVSPSELQEFFDSFDNVLCDCDGVVFTSFQPITGAKEGIAILRKLDKAVYFVSNNCTRPIGNFAKLLAKFDAQKEDVIIPTVAIIAYLKSIKFSKKLFVLGFEAMKQDLRDSGFEIVDCESDYVKENLESIATHLQVDPDVGAVIADFDVNMSYMKLQKALTYMKRPEVLFMIGGIDKFIPIAKDQSVIGTESFHGILQELSGRSPLVFGKPGKHINEYLLEKYKLKPERTLFIGDSFGDMIFATNGGYQKLVVLSGVIKEKDLANCQDKNLLPKYHINSLGELHKLITNKLY